MSWTYLYFRLYAEGQPLCSIVPEVINITDYETIYQFESLYAAHKTARKGKRHKKDVIAFELNLSEELWKIQQELESEEYNIKDYNCFMITDPKVREIQALPYADRIVQHSLCDNILTPFFENRLIYDNCACRVGKGTHFGIKRLTSFLTAHYKTNGNKGYILKLDIRKYFGSIPQKILLNKLKKVIIDPKVMSLLEKIVKSHNSDSCTGLPMGNQTSQLFGLYYLDSVDRLIKEKLRIKHYTRYMDDMIILHPDKAFLKTVLLEIEKEVERLGLELNEKTQILPIKNGVDYLGWHFYLSESGKVVRRLRGNNKKRFKKRLKGLQKGYEEGRIELEEVKQSLAASMGYLKQGHSYGLRKELLKDFALTKKEEEIK